MRSCDTVKMDRRWKPSVIPRWRATAKACRVDLRWLKAVSQQPRQEESGPRDTAHAGEVDVGCVLVFILREHSSSSDIESELKKREANHSHRFQTRYWRIWEKLWDWSIIGWFHRIVKYCIFVGEKGKWLGYDKKKLCGNSIKMCLAMLLAELFCLSVDKRPPYHYTLYCLMGRDYLFQ